MRATKFLAMPLVAIDVRLEARWRSRSIWGSKLTGRSVLSATSTLPRNRLS
jgi:hypothetical protein